MPVSLDTEWTPGKKAYRLEAENITIAEATLNSCGIHVRFFDDHHEVACLRLRSQVFTNWDAADYAVLLIANDFDELKGR